MTSPVMEQRPAGRLAALGPLLLALALVAVPVLIGQQVPARLRQELGADEDLHNVTGLYSPEQGEDGAFRWSGDQVTIQLQPLGYPLDATLHVQGVRPADQPPAQLGLRAGGTSLGTRELPRSPSDQTVRLPGTALWSINPQLDMTSTVFQVPGDRRTLGTVFYRLETSTGPAPALPLPWPATALLLSGLLAYAATRAATGRVRLALAVSGAWGLLLGVLNATARPWLVFYAWYWVVPPLVVWLLVPWLHGIRQRRRHPSPVSAPPEPDLTTQPWPLALSVVGAAVLVLAWHLLVPLVPSGSGPTDNATWGVLFYSALPWPLQALGVLIVLGALVWGVGGWGLGTTGVGGWGLGVGAQGSGIKDQGSGIRDQGSEDTEATDLQPPSPILHPPTPNPQPPSSNPFRWLPWALVGGGLLLFSLLPVQYSEGDSAEFDEKIPKGALWRERELLDFYLKARLWRVLQPWLPRPSQLYALVATLAGGVYLAGAWLLGRTLGRSRRESLVLVAGLVAIANLLLYFGYVESYALVQVTSLFVLWACWQYTQGRLSFGAVGALATLAPLFHGSALWWGPMVMVAWGLRARREPPGQRWRTALREGAEGVAVGLAIMLVLISVALIDGYNIVRFQQGLAEMGGADGRTMMPLFTAVSPYEHYVFFSWAHLGAVIQEQLLTAPLALLTIGIILIGAWPGVRRLAGAVPGVITLGVGAAGMFFYSISWNPDLGPRNDWDLLSLPALPLSLLAVYLLLHLPAGRARRLALAAYLSVSAVHAGAWVALHVLGLRT